jgi:hypothetical protein
LLFLCELCVLCPCVEILMYFLTIPPQQQ